MTVGTHLVQRNVFFLGVLVLFSRPPDSLTYLQQVAYLLMAVLIEEYFLFFFLFSLFVLAKTKSGKEERNRKYFLNQEIKRRVQKSGAFIHSIPLFGEEIRNIRRFGTKNPSIIAALT